MRALHYAYIHSLSNATIVVYHKLAVNTDTKFFDRKFVRNLIIVWSYSTIGRPFLVTIEKSRMDRPFQYKINSTLLYHVRTVSVNVIQES